MIIFKDGVSVEGITKECISGMFEVASYYDLYLEEPLTITSVSDGKHRSNSKHYEGNAFDIRTWTAPSSGVQISNPLKNDRRDRIYEVLGDHWDVVVEGTHIHCEYDPK